MTADRPTRVVAAIALAALALAGCGDSPSEATPTPATPGGHYEVVDDPCAHVDLAPITAILPYVSEQLQVDDSAAENTMLCHGSVGLSEDDDGSLLITVETFDDESGAEEHFNQFYGSNVALYGGTDIAGIGERAYQFVVPGVGAGTPAVRVLDGNAVLTCAWYPLNDDPSLPDGLFEAMTETIRATMTSLQAS